MSEDRSATGNVASTGNGNAAPGGGAGDREKKLRNLEKKLRQIDQLKWKRDAGVELEPEQVVAYSSPPPPPPPNKTLYLLMGRAIGYHAIVLTTGDCGPD